MRSASVWQLKSLVLNIINKPMPLLFRPHLSERGAFDERTAVIVGDRHKHYDDRVTLGEKEAM